MWGYKYIFKILLSILLGTYTEIELFNHMLVLLLIIWGTTILFYIVAMSTTL